MAGKNNGHEASASAAGYLYQCRIALLIGLRAIPTNPNLSVSVERFDDVAFDATGTPAELIQTKHHIGKSGNLTNASADLWKTLLIWSKATKADSEAPFRTRFLLMTTGAAPIGSAAHCLRAKDGERNEEEADKILMKTATTSTSVENAEAYKLYTALSSPVRLSLLKAITVLDSAPDIVDVVDELEQGLYYAAPKGQVAHLVERLEGWWFATVIKAMLNKTSIPVLAIDQRVDELREEFKRTALPVDLKNTAPPQEVIAEMDSRPFVKQLRRIEIGSARIEYAIRDFYRASEQRSRWLRQDLLVDGELEKYEQELREAWEPRFASMSDSLPKPCSPEKKVAGGQEVFKWVEQEANFPLRTVRERFLTHGSYHILSNRKVVGWHPDFSNPEANDDQEKKK
ncbi:MAG: ABC-three component system protein [Acidobacteriaceae bacterium]